LQKKFGQFEKRLYFCSEDLRKKKHKDPTTMANYNYRTIERPSSLDLLAVSVVGPATSGDALFKTLPQCTINFSKFPTGNC